MTQRNFFVNHGLECGDIVISATTNTITGLSTAAPSADGDVANKKYVDDQDAAIASDSLVFTNKTFDANGTGNSITNIEVADLAAGVLDTDLSSVSASDDTLPSAKATKAYVDSATSALVDLDTTITQGNSSVVVADTGSGTITATVDGATVATFQPGDLALPNNVGLLFGTGGEKIESNGTDLTITSTGALQLTVTGTTTVSGALAVSGDLTVNGTTTTNNSVNLTVDDNIIELNSGISQSFNDAGFIIERGTTGDNACFIWDESADEFTLGTTTATAGDKSGGITVSTGTLRCTVTSAQYSDVAERFAADGMYEPGTVVALGGAAEITAVAEEASDEVFGVVSSIGQAAVKMNSSAGSDSTHPYIAMTGRVQVKVMGAVNKGDRLISASVPGYARAATKAECTAFNVIGRALDSKQSEEAGSVLAAVRVSH